MAGHVRAGRVHTGRRRRGHAARTWRRPPARSLPGRLSPQRTGPRCLRCRDSAFVDRVAPAIVTVRVEKHAEVTPTALPEGPRAVLRPTLPRPARRAPERPWLRRRHPGRWLHPDESSRHRRRGEDSRRSRRWAFAAREAGRQRRASDLAVLRIEKPACRPWLTGIRTQAKVGDVVLAFGNPLGVGQTVTMGIVSAKGRATGVGDGSYEDFLQTDAPINQGNSGGALVNLQGELLGINAQILSPSGGNIGLGFAIPATMARAVADQLIAGRHRPSLEAGRDGAARDAGAGGRPGRGRRTRRADQRRRAGGPGAHAGLRAGRRRDRARRPHRARCQRPAQPGRQPGARHADLAHGAARRRDTSRVGAARRTCARSGARIDAK